MDTTEHTTVRRAGLRAMGSAAEVIVVGGPDGLSDLARYRIEALEQRWSRFRDDSEVSELNRGAGSWVAVSDDTLLLIARATEGWRLSGGRFDPTILGSVLRAGYDTTFESIGLAAPAAPSALFLGCDDIEVDGHRVRLPAGTGFDPGGIGKGLAADIIVAELRQAGAAGACVNLGGDLRVSGLGPDQEIGGWTVAVEPEESDRPLCRVGLADGGIATSTTLRRRWTVDGEPRHHLIDPDTGRPSTTDLTTVTVIAGAAWKAEILAKAVLLRGSNHPFDLIEGSGAHALAVTDAGAVLGSDGLAAFLGGTPLPTHLAALTGSEPSR